MGARLSAPIQTGPGAQPASCTMGTGPFPSTKEVLAMPWRQTPLSPVAYKIGVTQGGITTFCLITYCLPAHERTTRYGTSGFKPADMPACTVWGLPSFITLLCNCHEWPHDNCRHRTHSPSSSFAFIHSTGHMNQPLRIMKCCS